MIGLKRFLILLSLAFCFYNCSSDDEYISIEAQLYEPGEEYLTGNLGVNSTSNNAFGFSVSGLSIEQQSKFATGNSLFNQSWVSAPASTTARDGLGPTFNARACASCHFKDGRGQPLFNGESSKGFLMRISTSGTSVHGAPNPVAGYGDQIQDQANNGIPIEANITVTYQTIVGAYADGSSYELQKPIYSFSNENFGSLAGVMTSPRVGQQTIGLGFVSALAASEILQFEDEFDADNDGISGRANLVYDIETQSMVLGKYGWKANVSTLKQQVASAFRGDMGLTNALFPGTNCPSPQQDCFDAPNGGDLEVTNLQLNQVTFYQSSLAVPNRRHVKDASVLNGKVLFNDLKCINCHQIDLVTSNNFPTNPLLQGVTIKPYSDFLLHDMGEALADGRPDFLATGSEWRTQPLWGIGLIPNVNGHSFLMHDGRARNVEEAILWHGGEASASQEQFKNLNEVERQQVLDFVNSL